MTSSYAYSIEYTDNNNNGKYGHKIEVKDGSAKVNVHSQHPKSVEQVVLHTQHEGLHQVPQRTPIIAVPQHQQQPAHVSYIPATNIQEGHAQYQQKLKLPVNNDPKLPIHNFDQQQLALLLTQNKNPFLPMIPSKENNQIPHHQQILSSSKQSAASSLTQSQPQKVTYYVPQPTPSYTKPQETPTYSKQILSYTADPKYASQGVTYKPENGLQFEESPKMVQYQYEYSHPQPPQLYYQPVQYMQLGATQPKSDYPNYNNYYNIPFSSGLTGSSEVSDHGLQYTVPAQTSPAPHSGQQNIQHYQTVQSHGSGETSHTVSPQYYANLPQLSNQHIPQYIPQTVLQPSIQYKTAAGSSFDFSQYAQIPQHPQQLTGNQVGPVQFLPQAQGQSQGHSLAHLFVKPQGAQAAPPTNQNHFSYQQAVQTTNKAPQIASYPANLFTSGQYEYVYPGQKQTSEETAVVSNNKGPSFRSLGTNAGHFGDYLSNPAGKPQNLPIQSVQPAPPTQGHSYHFLNVQGYKPTIPTDKIPYKDSNTFNYNQIDFQPSKSIIYTPQHFNSNQNNYKPLSALPPKQQIQPHQTIEHKSVLNIAPTQPNYYSYSAVDSGYQTGTPGTPAATGNANQVKYIYTPSYNANQAETVKGK